MSFSKCKILFVHTTYSRTSAREKERERESVCVSVCDLEEQHGGHEEGDEGAGAETEAAAAAAGLAGGARGDGGAGAVDAADGGGETVEAVGGGDGGAAVPEVDEDEGGRAGPLGGAGVGVAAEGGLREQQLAVHRHLEAALVGRHEFEALDDRRPPLQQLVRQTDGTGDVVSGDAELDRDAVAGVQQRHGSNGTGQAGGSRSPTATGPGSTSFSWARW